MIASTEQHQTKLRTAALMGVVGALFVALAVVTGNVPVWAAAAAINFLGAADALRQHYRLSGATA